MRLAVSTTVGKPRMTSRKRSWMSQMKRAVSEVVSLPRFGGAAVAMALTASRGVGGACAALELKLHTAADGRKRVGRPTPRTCRAGSVPGRCEVATKDAGSEGNLAQSLGRAHHPCNKAMQGMAGTPGLVR